VYDDSLSYYELLCKVVDFLNKTMEDVETLESDVTNIYEAYVELQTYVNEYFSSLDVQEEINNKLDEMSADGSLSEIIAPFIPDSVSEWLSEHIEPTSPPIDDTLSVSGAGADAKVTGDEFKKTIMAHTVLIEAASLFVAPYDDFNTLPNNSIISYAQGYKPLHAPADLSGYFTVLVYSRSDDRTYKSLTTQVITKYDTQPKMWYRVSFGGSASPTWSEWAELSDIAILNSNLNKTIMAKPTIIDSSTLFATPYDDFNTLPNNSIISYAQGYTPANAPSGLNGYFTVLVYSRSDDRNYRSLTTQVITKYDTQPKMWYRVSFGGSASPTWSEWILVNSSDSVIGSGLNIYNASTFVAPYDDLNTLPMNTIIHYGDIDDYHPENMPVFEQLAGGITVMSFSRSTDRNYTSLCFQFCANATSAPANTDYELFYRVSWGGASAPVWSEWQRLLTKNFDKLGKTNFTPSLFHKIGVIGDSFASGLTGTGSDDYPNSWLQMMCRQYGCTGYNFSHGGLTTRSWLTDENGLTKLNNTEACDLYFIALGINDSNPDSRHVDVGTISDMSASPLPDTYYGNMRKILNAIFAKNSKAVVCFITPQRIGDRYTPYQEAVVNICNNTKYLIVDWRDVPFASSNFWINNLRDLHPSIPEYNLMMNTIVTLLGESIRKKLYLINTYPN